MVRFIHRSMLLILSSLSGVPATTPSPCLDFSKKLTNDNKEKILLENGSNETLVGCFDTSKVTNMDSFLMGRDFNADLNSWDVSSVTNMTAMFFAEGVVNINNFNGDVSKWDVSSVTDMRGMFDEAIKFNGNVSKWDVSSVTNMQGMFQAPQVNDATEFNGDVSKWDVSSVTDMTSVFDGASQFGVKLCDWDLAGTKNVNRMFTNSNCTVIECVECTSLPTISPTTFSFPSAGPSISPTTSSFPSAGPSSRSTSLKSSGPSSLPSVFLFSLPSAVLYLLLCF